MILAIAQYLSNWHNSRLRVVSNFGDSGEIHARARKWAPEWRRATIAGAENLVARLLAGTHFRARACISPESPKLETTRSQV